MSWGPAARMKQSKNNGKYFPEINPCTYGQLIYNKGGTNMQWRKESTTDAGRSTGQPQARVKLDPHLTPCGNK